jgi:hypothetical protein
MDLSMSLYCHNGKEILISKNQTLQAASCGLWHWQETRALSSYITTLEAYDRPQLRYRVTDRWGGGGAPGTVSRYN